MGDIYCLRYSPVVQVQPLCVCVHWMCVLFVCVLWIEKQTAASVGKWKRTSAWCRGAGRGAGGSIEKPQHPTQRARKHSWFEEVRACSAAVKLQSFVWMSHSTRTPTLTQSVSTCEHLSSVGGHCNYSNGDNETSQIVLGHIRFFFFCSCCVRINYCIDSCQI